MVTLKIHNLRYNLMTSYYRHKGSTLLLQKIYTYALIIVMMKIIVIYYIEEEINNISITVLNNTNLKPYSKYFSKEVER